MGDSSRSSSPGAAAAVAALATISVGATLVVIRGHVHNSLTALLLAAVVCICGSLGGWQAGIASAFAAAVSFNFFHTQPYLSLRIHDADDIWTTLTLLLVGTVAGLTTSVARRRADAAVTSRGEAQALERIAGLAATGVEPADLELAVRAELLGLLKLGDVTFDPAPMSPSILGRRGETSNAPRVFHHGGFELPSHGVAIPVLQRGTAIGFLNCVPLPGTSVPDSRRRAAIAVADVLGAALPTPHRPASRQN